MVSKSARSNPDARFAREASIDGRRIARAERDRWNRRSERDARRGDRDARRARVDGVDDRRPRWSFEAARRARRRCARATRREDGGATTRARGGGGGDGDGATTRDDARAR